MIKNYVLTIDGPAASGKTSVARGLAERFNLFHIKGGTFLRAFAYFSLIKKVKVSDECQVTSLINEFELTINQAKCESEYSVILNGVIIDDKLWTPEVDSIVSITSSYHRIREYRTKWERGIAQGRAIVADGRTMGSEVFPDASLKIYLSASISSRAERRYFEYLKRGVTNSSIADIQLLLSKRDEMDAKFGETNRVQCYPDQIFIDNTSLTKNETIDSIARLILQSGGP